MSEGRLNLLLLPYAGAGAGVFRDWPGRCPAWINPIPLTLPGRGVRHGEPLLHEWPALLDLLVREVTPHLESPFALFGHSLGALIAAELANAIRARFARTPVWLGVSGCVAPSRRRLELKWLNCPEEEFLSELRALRGTPPELLGNRELLDLVMPVLRADFHLAGSYRPSPRPPLPVPLLVLAGTLDRDVSADPENLSAWSRETTGPMRIKTIDAGHFFLDTHRDVVIRHVLQGLWDARRALERADA
ncbi:MAG TPA: alpha/beta fold hydrolase [Rhodopila sp.]